MYSRFAIAVTLALLVSAPPPTATAETMTLDEYISGRPDATAATETAQDDNPFEDVACEATTAVPPTPASAGDKPSVYVIVAASGRGDVAYRMDCTTDATVGSVLRKAVYPHPIDFKTTRIVVHRPRHHVNDDLTVEAEERIFRVEWDATTGQPTAKTNHRLEPNDRLILMLPPTAAPVPRPYQSAPVAGGIYPAPYTPPVPASPAPAILAATPQYYAPDASQAVVYSALPAAVPSPFASDAAAVLAPAITPAPVLPTNPIPGKVTQVQFDIVVVEDLDNSFGEFDELQSRMPFMLADTATIEGTLRILEKHKLVRRISEPKLITTSGRPATLQVGGESPDPQEPWQGIKTTVSARELGGGLAVEFGFKNTVGRRTNEVQTSLIVPHGQTVVMKTGGQLAEAAKADTSAKDEKDKVERAVYVVLTPEIVK